MMTTESVPNVTEIDDAATARWLSKSLDGVRADVASDPSANVVDRIRARIFGDWAQRRTTGKIAA